MEEIEARAVLADVDRLEGRVRADQQVTPAALTAAALVTAASAAALGHPFLVWPVGQAAAVLVGCLGLAAWFAVRRRRSGVGTAALPAWTAGIGVALAAGTLFFPALAAAVVGLGLGLAVLGLVRRQLAPGLWGAGLLLTWQLWTYLAIPLALAPLLGVACALLGLALWRRDGLLAVVALAYGILVALWSFQTLANLGYRLGLDGTLNDAVSAAVPLLVVAGGAVLAWRRDRRA